MATTTNYSFDKPTVGGSENSWGTSLNSNWDSIDSTLYNALTGATATTPNVTAGSWKISGTAITPTAAQVNYLTGVTSAIQTQFDAKAPLADPTFTGTTTAPTISSTTITAATITGTTVNATTVDLGDWTITESSGVLYFATGGTNKMKLDASGNLTVVGNVTAYGTM